MVISDSYAFYCFFHDINPLDDFLAMIDSSYYALLWGLDSI